MSNDINKHWRCAGCQNEKRQLGRLHNLKNAHKKIEIQFFFSSTSLISRDIAKCGIDSEKLLTSEEETHSRYTNISYKKSNTYQTQ